MTICIIPARGNSKRIKNKNLIRFNGKPIIYYSILIAKRVSFFQELLLAQIVKKLQKLQKNLELKFLL